MTSQLKVDRISPATGSEIIIDGLGAIDGIGASNDFAFVKRSTDQILSAKTVTKVQFDSEIYDSNNWFDSSTNYRFQPDSAGNYLCFANISLSNAYHANQPFNIFFYKNGSEFLGTTTNHRYDETFMDTFSGIINFNGSTDYVEVYVRFTESITIESSSNLTTSETSTSAYFVRLT